ncbi:MAG: hypothetical protein KUG75_03105 [Pseudomonadales bacterium]|nr:hypothetical protein [Pseudomonadales bacterium]
MSKKIVCGLFMSMLLTLSSVASAQNSDDLKTMQTFLNIMDSYFELIEASHEINSDAEKAAIFQLQKLKEVYSDRGERARVTEVFRDVLKRTQNLAIRNAVYMLLSDNLKETGRMDEAIKILQQGLQENIQVVESE